MVFSPLMGFQLLLLFSLMFSLSSSSLFLLWVSLEINMLSFLPIMSSETKISLENTMKYFLIQSFASIMFLITSIFMFFMNFWPMNFILVCAMFLKLGVAPFHNWFISLMKTVNLRMLFFLSSIQKWIPLIILTQLTLQPFLLLSFFIASLMVIFLGGMGALSLNKVLALSSMNSTLWMIISGMKNIFLLCIFFLIYLMLLSSLLIISFNFLFSSFSQLHSLYISTKLMLIFSFLSLGGLPPFLGFLGKVLVFKNCFFIMSFLFFMVLVFNSLMILFYYISISYFCLLGVPNEMNMLNMKQKKYFEYLYLVTILLFSLLGSMFL